MITSMFYSNENFAEMMAHPYNRLLLKSSPSRRHYSCTQMLPNFLFIHLFLSPDQCHHYWLGSRTDAEFSLKPFLMFQKPKPSKLSTVFLAVFDFTSTLMVRLDVMEPLVLDIFTKGIICSEFKCNKFWSSSDSMWYIN